SGGWTFIDDFRTEGRILLSAGHLNTNGKTVRANTFNYPTSGVPLVTSAVLDISNSEIRVNHWSFRNTNITATNSHIYANGRFYSANGSVYHNLTVSGDFEGSSTFNEVLIVGNTVMRGNNTFNKLILQTRQLTLTLNN